MELLVRFYESLTQRGIRRTLQTGMSISEDYFFDFRHHTDTARRVRLKTLLIPSANKHEAMDYIPTRGRAFRKLLDALRFPPDSVFVDFGSGKGKLLLLASKYNFKRIIGLEFSADLCETARRNVAAYQARQQRTPTEVVCTDVADYRFADDENVFFFFNPFNRSVMTRVLEKIEASSAARPREMWLIYCDPYLHDLIRQQTRFEKVRTYVYGGHEFIVYKRPHVVIVNDASAASQADVVHG